MKSADHLGAVKRMRVSENELAPLVPHYQACVLMLTPFTLDLTSCAGCLGQVERRLRTIKGVNAGFSRHGRELIFTVVLPHVVAFVGIYLA